MFDSIKSFFTSGKKKEAIQLEQASRKREEHKAALRQTITNLIQAEGLFGTLNVIYNGEKFAGGLGLSKDYEVVDLFQLRRYSLQFWRSNPIAVGIFKRLVDNIICDGLMLEADPNDKILSRAFGLSEDEITEWTELVESLAYQYFSQKDLVDIKKKLPLNMLSKVMYMTCKISGDCLVIRRPDPVSGFPVVQLIDGIDIFTPIDFTLGINPKTGNRVVHGVEIDSDGAELGFWVKTRGINPQRQGTLLDSFQYVPAYNSLTGRRQADLVFGSQIRVNEYRGLPLLAHAIQMLDQIDKALDSEHLAMLIDSLIVLALEKDKDAPASISDMLNTEGGFDSAALSKDEISVSGASGVRTSQLKGFGPGIVIDGLPRGTKVTSHNNRRPNVNVMSVVAGAFELIASSVGIPPEIALLKFGNNFSASRQAAIEFNVLVTSETADFSVQALSPIYYDFLYAAFLRNMLPMPGYYQALLSNDRWIIDAWNMCSWRGIKKPSVDELKQVNTFIKMVENGFMSRSRITEIYYGGSFEKNIKQLSSQNKKLAIANAPLAALEAGVMPEEENENGSSGNDNNQIKSMVGKMIAAQMEALEGQLEDKITAIAEDVFESRIENNRG